MNVPTQILNKGDHLEISWPDGRVGKYSCFLLRDSCPCAHCIHEITGEKLLDPASIPADIHAASLSLTGNYALKINWSDGHDSGLYTWERLDELFAEASA